MKLTQPSTWFAAKPKAKTAGPGYEAPAAQPAEPVQKPAGVVVSIERPQFGMSGGGAWARTNLDDLARKKGLPIYAKMRLDEQVKAATTFKRDAIVSRGWTFEFEKESVLSDKERATRIKVLNKIVEELNIGFIDALNVISTGRDFGFSLTEKVYGRFECEGKTYAGLQALLGRDPQSFEFFTDDFGNLIKCQQNAAGRFIPINLAKFVHYVHNPEFDYYFGRSDLREAYRSWYFKDMMIRYWGLYMEKLGGGVTIVSIAPEANIQAGTPQYESLQAALSDMKASPGIILPAGVTAQVLFPQDSEAFEKACTFHDLSIAKALLVPNLMGVSHTGSTGAYSQSQTQLETFAWTLQADAKRLEGCVDRQVFRDLQDQNWGDGEYARFKFKPLSDDKLRWVIDTWSKLIGANAVVATEEDEARLREILEMPPRDPKAKPLVDPTVVASQTHEADMADKQHALGQDAKDAEAQRSLDTDKQRALDPVLAGEADKERKAKAAAAAKKFGYNPNQERDKDGRWTADGASADLQEHLDRELDGMEHYSGTIDAGTRAAIWDAVTSEKLPPNLAPSVVKGLRAALKSIYDRPKEKNVKYGDAKREAKRLMDYLDKHHGASKYTAPSLRDARINIASARERVDFAVIDRKQMALARGFADDMALIVATAVAKELGDDASIAKLTDADVADIGQVQLHPVAVGKLKVRAQKALADAWTLGKEHAQREVRRSNKLANIRFADLRDNAAAYFDSNAFMVAGDVSDRARSVIQQELLTSVKVGRSPPQTRTAIWERLVAKGFSSREAVRSVESDSAVNDALDELWKDTEEAAMAYLDTVARTNLFAAMNEARYAEFTDPALGDFVVALRYSAVLDDRTTEICQELHDSVFAADSVVWDEYKPPNHFNCRSVLIPVTQLDVEDGLWDGEESDAPTVAPQEGFGS